MARGVQHSAKSCSLKAPPPTQADLMGTTTGPSPSHDAGDPGDPGSPSTQAATGSAARSAAYATTSNVQPAAQTRSGQARPDLSTFLCEAPPFQVGGVLQYARKGKCIKNHAAYQRIQTAKLLYYGLTLWGHSV